MYTVMVTGGLGSGKSTLCRMLCEHGAVSIDLDEINRTLLQSNEDYIAELVGRFGSAILDASGAVVPGELARRAFADEESERDLNEIAFPYITQMANEYILDVHCTPRSDAQILVVEVPLLTDVPEFAELADEVIAVAAPSDLRLQRAIARGMDAADAARRLQVQATDAERAALADTVYDNTGTTEDMAAWCAAWWDSRMTRIEEKREAHHG